MLAAGDLCSPLNEIALPAQLFDYWNNQVDQITMLLSGNLEQGAKPLFTLGDTESLSDPVICKVVIYQIEDREGGVKPRLSKHQPNQVIAIRMAHPQEQRGGL